MPIFTVIIPTRNRPEFLSEAINSVLQQSCDDFELLLVNDGETEIQAPDDARCRVLNNAQRGAVVARNFGVAAARGNYIAFLDDDDVWTDADHLTRALNALEQRCDFYFADGVMNFPDGTKKPFDQHADVTTLQFNNTILVSAICYKKSLHKSLGAFDEALPFYWDWDWYLRVARSGAILLRWSFSVVDIRIHAQNMSGDQNVVARRHNLDLLEIKHALNHIQLKGHLDFV
jgi:glycosyltransferase involved in cell wall biosynthesis